MGWQQPPVAAVYALAGLAAAVFALLTARHAIDFRVYYATATAFRLHGGPVYGSHSGNGGTMIFRYPPLGLLLFYPLALLPFRWAVAVWGGLNGLALTGATRAWRQRFWKPQMNVGGRVAGVLVPVMLFGPYFVQELRSGNAQFMTVALSCWGLLLLERAPVRGASLLALATYLKVWPIFFGPLLLVRRRWKAAAAGVLWLLLLTPATSVLLGWRRTVSLSRQWVQQEYSLNTRGREIWYPSQSLHGVLARYLAPVDYSALPDSNYREVNIAHVGRTTVERLWLVCSLGLYVWLLIWTARLPQGAIEGQGAPSSGAFVEANAWAMAFCLVLLIEPNVHRIVLVDLLWPALTAARWLVERNTTTAARVLLWTAAIAALVEPLIPGAASQRFMQVLGVDFAIIALVSIGLWIAAGPRGLRAERAGAQSGG